MIAKSAVAESADPVAGADPVASVEPRPPDEIQTLLAAISTVLRETVAAFETTVTRITEITVTRPGRADRDLVVALQDFDRLQQEFATLGDVIGTLSNRFEGSAGQGTDQDVIANISLAGLKERLLHQLRLLAMDPEPEAEEVEF